MRGDGVKAEDKRPQPHATWQPNSDRLSAERKPDPTDVRENGSPTMRPERLVMADITATPKSKTRSPDKNLTSLYRVLRLHGNQLFQSTKRSLVIAKQSAQQKFAARAASRKAMKEARDLAQLRSVLLIDFWPSKQAEQAQLRDADEVGRQAEETRRQAEAPARIKTEQERQQAEQARLKVEEETKRKAEGAGRHAAALARIEAEHERQQAEQARLKAEEETERKGELARTQAEAQARIKAEQERRSRSRQNKRDCRLKKRREEQKRRADTQKRRPELKQSRNVRRRQNKRDCKLRRSRLRIQKLNTARNASVSLAATGTIVCTTLLGWLARLMLH